MKYKTYTFKVVNPNIYKYENCVNLTLKLLSQISAKIGLNQEKAKARNKGI